VENTLNSCVEILRGKRASPWETTFPTLSLNDLTRPPRAHAANLKRFCCQFTRVSKRECGQDLGGLSLLAIFFFVELTLLFGSGILVLLVLGH